MSRTTSTDPSVSTVRVTAPLVRESPRWILLTALGSILMGTAYIVTHEFLPIENPLYGALFRAAPAAVLLLIITRKLPRGDWWWKSFVLGALNFSGFFVCIYLASSLLPSSVAATVVGAAPVVIILMAWLVIREKPRALSLVGGVMATLGVVVVFYGDFGGTNIPGVLAAAGAILSSTFGILLTKRWKPQTDVISATSWQLMAGAIVLAPFAIIIEGAPPTLSMTETIAFGYISLVATGIAFCLWFGALRHVRAGTVALLGMLSPLTGVVTGLVFGGDPFGMQQALGIGLVFLGILVGQPFVTALWRRARHRSGLDQDFPAQGS